MNEREKTEQLLKRLEKHSRWTYEHSIRVSGYAVDVGRCLGMEPQDLKLLWTAARLHDIGKMAIPADILDKTGSLTEEEYQSVKSHTIYGYLFLKLLGYPHIICETVKDHHERYDGRGYGAKKEIGMSAKIICAVDSYDAMKFTRPYKKRLMDGEIYQEIEKNSGKQFDPEVCLAVLRTLF